MSKTVKYTDRLNDLKKDAKETYELLTKQEEMYADLMKEGFPEDYKWLQDLVDESHRIRKALKDKIKKGVDANKKPIFISRPNTKEYLENIAKRIEDLAGDMEDLFSNYDLSDSD